MDKSHAVLNQMQTVKEIMAGIRENGFLMAEIDRPNLPNDPGKDFPPNNDEQVDAYDYAREALPEWYDFLVEALRFSEYIRSVLFPRFRERIQAGLLHLPEYQRESLRQALTFIEPQMETLTVNVLTLYSMIIELDCHLHKTQPLIISTLQIYQEIESRVTRLSETER